MENGERLFQAARKREHRRWEQSGVRRVLELSCSPWCKGGVRSRETDALVQRRPSRAAMSVPLCCVQSLPALLSNVGVADAVVRCCSVYGESLPFSKSEQWGSETKLKNSK